MPVMTLSTLLTPGSSVTAALVFPGTAPSLLFMYLQWVCPNNAPDLQRATIVYGPPVILHFTLWSQLDVTELMSGQIITCVPELIQRMLLCTVSLADRAASYAPAQVNRYQIGLTSTLQCLLNGVQSQDEANLIPIFSRCSSRNSIYLSKPACSASTVLCSWTS